MGKPDVVIVGGGLAGICCALRLQELGASFVILEASERMGGRVRTDRITGYQLDRGFQVLLTAYPECRRQLDYDALELGEFRSGALIRYDGKFHKLGDPMRNWADALPSFLSPVGPLSDKLKINSLRKQVTSGTLEELYERPETSTLERLGSLGFSAVTIERFFRPFLGGIFLERELSTSSRKFEFVFRMFAQGGAALPAKGMQAIPDQLAARIRGEVRLGARAGRVEEGRVRLANGQTLEAPMIAIAADEVSATKLVGMEPPERSGSTTCIYYAAKESPVDGQWLVLNGDGKGPVNNLCVPSEVRPEYAPEDQALVSVSVVGHGDVTESSLESQVRAQLSDWYGPRVLKWRVIKIYRIASAVPYQPAGALSPVEKPARLTETIFVCGDHADSGSIQGAMASGRRCAEAMAAAG